MLATAAALAPVALVVVLLRKLGYGADPRQSTWFAVGLGVLSVLLIARGFATYRRSRRFLAAFRVAVAEEELVVETPFARMRVPRAAIARVLDLDGALGGLRLELREMLPAGDAGDADIPERIDIPRGGERFGELRAQLAAWQPVERAPRRSRAMRLAIGAAIVMGIFFLPFVLEDFVGRSKLVALGLVLGLWLATRLLTRR
jgi:hypothetical protein